MALFPNAKYVNDGASGSNGLSVVSAKGKLYEPMGGVYGALRNLFTTPQQRNMEEAYKELFMDRYNESIADGSEPGEAILDAAGVDPDPEPKPKPPKPTKSTAKPIVYSDWTPAAQLFGMDQNTAYAEHLANTAHQREVADLRAAGLNPVLGLGSGASGVTGHVAMSSTNGSLGYSSAKKGLDDSTIDALAATAGVIATLVSKKPYIGNSIGNAVKQIGRAFFD